MLSAVATSTTSSVCSRRKAVAAPLQSDSSNGAATSVLPATVGREERVLNLKGVAPHPWHRFVSTVRGTIIISGLTMLTQHCSPLSVIDSYCFCAEGQRSGISPEGKNLSLILLYSKCGLLTSTYRKTKKNIDDMSTGHCIMNKKKKTYISRSGV